MRNLVVGLVVGSVIGAAGTYLVLRWPGASGSPQAMASDAGAAPDAAPAARRRGGKRRHAARPAAHQPAAADVEENGTDPPPAEPELPALSAADREAVWRGPAIQTPTRRLDLAARHGGRPLSQYEIDRGIRANAAAVTTCVREARGEAPLSGTVTLEFLVEGSGRATHSRVRAPRYLLDRGLLACAQRAVRGMRFAATGEPTVVTVPFAVR
jgi:hypothetical protein